MAQVDLLRQQRVALDAAIKATKDPKKLAQLAQQRTALNTQITAAKSGAPVPGAPGTPAAPPPGTTGVPYPGTGGDTPKTVSASGQTGDLTPPGGILPNGTKINDVGAGVNASAKVQEAQRAANLQANNPNYVGPDAASSVTLDANGKPTYTVSRSAPQQTIADQKDALSTLGTGIAKDQLGLVSKNVYQPTLTARPNQAPNSSFNPNLPGLAKQDPNSTFNPNITPRTTTGDLLTDRGRVEDAVYNSLTRDTNRQEQQDQQNLQQSLQNRGIPYSTDPNSRYQQEMKDFNNKYSDIRLAAKNQAVQTGGNEYRSDAGLTDSQRAQDYSIQAGTKGIQNQQYNDTFNQGLQGNQQAYDTQAGTKALQDQEYGQTFQQGETARANDIATQGQVHQQQISDIGSYSNAGGGLRDTGAPSYTGTNTTIADPVAVDAALGNLAIGQTNAGANVTSAQAAMLAAKAKVAAAGTDQANANSGAGTAANLGV